MTKSSEGIEQGSGLSDQVSGPAVEIQALIPSPANRAGGADQTHAFDSELSLRDGREEDIPHLVGIDIAAFRSVYAGYDIEEKRLRAELIRKFRLRFSLIGGMWTPVVEKDGAPISFAMACPTSKPPGEFRSWEDTTDDGTLETTYDPDGRYLYVVTLDAERGGKDLLMGDIIGKIVAGGFLGYFESRLPGLEAWAKTRCRERGTDLEQLSEEDRTALAEEYFDRKVEQPDGSQLPYDPLLRLYASIGCRILRLVPNAYQDGPSLNFGAVCTYGAL